MANAEKLWESFDDILAHRELWNQQHYIAGRVNRNATHWAECGTTQCIAGFRCLRDGGKLLTDSRGNAEGFTDEHGRYKSPTDHAARVFELGYRERAVLFGNMTTDLGDLKECIQEIIDGKYRSSMNSTMHDRVCGPIAADCVSSLRPAGTLSHVRDRHPDWYVGNSSRH